MIPYPLHWLTNSVIMSSNNDQSNHSNNNNKDAFPSSATDKTAPSAAQPQFVSKDTAPVSQPQASADTDNTDPSAAPHQSVDEISDSTDADVSAKSVNVSNLENCTLNGCTLNIVTNVNPVQKVPVNRHDDGRILLPNGILPFKKSDINNDENLVKIVQAHIDFLPHLDRAFENTIPEYCDAHKQAFKSWMHKIHKMLLATGENCFNKNVLNNFSDQDMRGHRPQDVDDLLEVIRKMYEQMGTDRFIKMLESKIYHFFDDNFVRTKLRDAVDNLGKASDPPWALAPVERKKHVGSKPKEMGLLIARRGLTLEKAKLKKQIEGLVEVKYRQRKPKSANNDVVVVNLQSPDAKSKKKSIKRYTVVGKTEAKKMDLDALYGLYKQRAEEEGVVPQGKAQEGVVPQGKALALGDSFQVGVGLSPMSYDSFAHGQYTPRDDSFKQTASQDNSYMFDRSHDGNRFGFDSNPIHQPTVQQGIDHSFGFQSNHNQGPSAQQGVGQCFGFQSNQNQQPSAQQGIGHSFGFQSNHNQGPPLQQGIGHSFGFQSNQNQGPPLQQGVGQSFGLESNQNHQSPSLPRLGFQHSGQQGIGPGSGYASNPPPPPPPPGLVIENTNQNSKSQGSSPPLNLTPVSKSASESAFESVNEEEPEYNEEQFGFVEKILGKKTEKGVLYYLCEWKDSSKGESYENSWTTANSIKTGGQGGKITEYEAEKRKAKKVISLKFPYKDFDYYFPPTNTIVLHTQSQKMKVCF